MKEFYIGSSGIKIHAKLDCPEGVEKAPLCILIHGFTGHMEEPHIIAAQKAMNDAGVCVLRAEMYGHGKSGGEFRDHTLFKWIENALSVLGYAESLGFVTDLYMCGHSQGGLLTMLIGGMCPDKFKAIIPLSPAWMIPGITRSGEVLGQHFDPLHIPEKILFGERELSGNYIRTAQLLHVEDAIAKFKRKVLIVHGDMDRTVPFSYAQKAAELYADAQLVTVSGADHCFVGHTAEMASAVKEFFTKTEHI